MYKKVTRALISVSDKSGILEFCSALNKMDIELISTGGTAKLLLENHIKVTEVSSHTNFPEMMDGRVKTLHPKIHGGILGRRGTDDDVMSANDIKAIDLVLVNLYPFEQTVDRTDCDMETAIENIDIGGPTLIRAAAKNHTDVAVVVNPGDYDTVLNELHENKGMLSQATRFKLALKGFEYTARYDTAIAGYLGKMSGEHFPNTLNLQFHRLLNMRYGENPHQNAAFYQENRPPAGSITTSRQLQGKELSYNNITDADAALECVKAFHETACVIVKHANPCGVAIAESIGKAYILAHQTDPTSAFGGIIAFNRELDEDAVNKILERQFVEVIIAPAIAKNAQKLLTQKPNIRVLECGYWNKTNLPAIDYKRVSGGLLIQDTDNGDIAETGIKIVSRRAPTTAETSDLLFAWKVAKFVKSNAIVYSKHGQTIGIGAGQMSRVYSAKIAGIKASEEGLSLSGAAMASDAFFPFRDGIDAAAAIGITAVIQPGGSMRDEEIVAAADEHNIAMAFTGMRHFRH